MNALKLRELLLLLLSASVSAAPGKSEAAAEQVSCNGQEQHKDPEPSQSAATEKTLYVGMFILTDSTFQACTSYRGDVLEDYLSAFVGSVSMRFWDLSSPAVEVIFTGSRALTDEEEQTFLGKEEGSLQGPVKGADAVNRLMDIEIKGESIYGQNVFYYVLTGRNITEEKTKAIINTDPQVSFDSSESSSEEESLSVNARSNTAKKILPTVEGLSQYGSICTASVGLGNDNGRNFSGVTTAAVQIANILGPMYNGTIERRKCDMDYMDDVTDFHFYECRTATTLKDDPTALEKYDCLQEPPQDKSSSNVTSPQQFFDKYQQWTPCGVSYLGSRECSNSNDASSLSSNCHLSCCLPKNIFKSSLEHIDITAPDGKICDSKKVCVAGNCTTEVATSANER